MKRSEINSIIREMDQLITDYRISLPPFCNWTPEQWQHRGHEYDEIRDNMLGWDITDYGLNNYNNTGFALITLRSGSQTDDRYPKPYAEKLLYLRENQLAPMHFHWIKMEDIINRGGGDLEITVYNADEKEDFADTDVHLTIDGKKVVVPAGGKVLLKPGQSVTLLPGQYHQWIGVPGTGPVMLFEVSTTNDDMVDNRFHSAQSRIPQIEEDEPAEYLIFNDYKDYVQL